MEITHHNPNGLYKNPAFSQAVSVKNAKEMIYVGGQNGINTDGKMVSSEVGAQSEQALKNVLEVLKSAGATQENVLKLTIYLVHGQDLQKAFEAAQKFWGMHATAVSVAIVSGLARPEALVEIDAVAAL